MSRGKQTTKQYLVLDVRKLHRDGYLVPGSHFTFTRTHSGRVFSVAVRAEENCLFVCLGADPIPQLVRLAWTPCNFGGKRPWFLCPSLGCWRRVATLYAGEVFACRTCHRLVYETQRLAGDRRAVRRAERIRIRLGGGGDVAAGFPRRPKGMHRRTYERLRGEADHAAFLARAWRFLVDRQFKRWRRPLVTN